MEGPGGMAPLGRGEREGPAGWPLLRSNDEADSGRVRSGAKRNGAPLVPPSLARHRFPVKPGMTKGQAGNDKASQVHENWLTGDGRMRIGPISVAGGRKNEDLRRNVPSPATQHTFTCNAHPSPCEIPQKWLYLRIEQ